MSVLTKLNITWNTIQWPKVRKRVSRMQYRIFMAKKTGKTKTVHALQRRLICSLDAKLLSVFQGTTLNKGKSTAGVDKTVFLSSPGKLKLALSLKLDGLAKPIRRVWIPKPGKAEKRPLGIPTIKDRAKQNLAKLALEPEWEAVFEPNSYGFRPGRSCHDAIEAIFLNLRHKRPKFVYDADIRKCFDRINHDALLKKLGTFPQMESQIKAWLKADIMEGYANSPKSITASTSGTPQGGVISPLLANIALHGLENHLKEFVSRLNIKPNERSNRGAAAKRKACGVVRYADDFVIIHENKQILELCVAESKAWLANIGLEISEEKSKLIDARQGFLFLGFQCILICRQKEYRIKISPSEASCLKLKDKVKKIISYSKASSAYDLITKLRPIIIGWANYFKYCECKKAFLDLTNTIFGMLRAWVFRRTNRQGRIAIKEKYFPSGCSYTFDGTTHKDNWILVGSKKDKKGRVRHIYLPHIVWVKSLKHIKILDDYSPFNGDHIYWAKRMAKYNNLPIRVKTLLSKQDYKCNICKETFTVPSNLEVDHIIPKSQGGKDTYTNLQLIHRTCHITKTRGEYIELKRSFNSNNQGPSVTYVNDANPSFEEQVHPYLELPTLEEIYKQEGF
ncbi:MAG: group II intron reverse transcriptase/maturase [Microcystis sp. M064S2]|uniref:group II intron reverse transcriptase/maturase n=1 Tax=Microcystis sp. M064S2 TaxID=2771172 RepID=UPI00258544D8|nr:group II intron reverse transcriptase/maturase [Microcystis sp. M064S2]MCA2661120.1 group II intron reverse transcriptase/maturase [Microcystis sp. M064S2]